MRRLCVSASVGSDSGASGSSDGKTRRPSQVNTPMVMISQNRVGMDDMKVLNGSNVK